MFSNHGAETRLREDLSLPDLEAVRKAADRLSGIGNRTPVITSRTLNDRLQAEIFFKCESFQRSGSFKFRGAFNTVSQLTDEERRRGVLTYSSGNHAQAMALVGRILGCAVTVVMPDNAPEAKREATRGYGAEIRLYDPGAATREEIARAIQEERGSPLIPPFDHPEIVAGQGTAGLELLEEVGHLDRVYAPCGGGGLLSGTALAAETVEGCRVFGVEPERADDATRTFRSGTLHTVSNPDTIADGLRTPSLGAVTWPIVSQKVTGMLTVTEDEIVNAMRFLWTRMKLVVEPSGAVALAGLLKDDVEKGGRVGVIISGGNVDLGFALALLR